MMKNLFLLTLILNTTYVYSKVSTEEMETFLEAVKEKKDEELILTSDQFKECQEKFTAFRENSQGEASSGNTNKQEFENCLNEKLVGKAGQDPVEANAQLLEIAKNLGLSSYNQKAAESPKSISDYLQKRIQKIIYGKDVAKKQLQKLKSQKFVDHEIFYQFYKEQVGKNTFLHVSRYCLEHFGLEDSKNVVLPIEQKLTAEQAQQVAGDTSDKEKVTYSIRYDNVVEEVEQKEKKFATNDLIPFNERFKIKQYIENNQDLKSVYENNFKSLSFSNFWRSHDTKLKEFEVCTLSNEKQCKDKFKDVPFRSLKTIEILKDSEFAFNNAIGNNDLLRTKFSFCAGTIIKNMCELYKCKNVYSENSPDVEKKRCLDTFGIIPSSLGGNQNDKMFSAENPAEQVTNFKNNLKSSDKTGSIACNVVQRLQEYRSTIKAINDIQEGLKNEKVDITRFAGASNFGFAGNFETGRSIDKLTSISSTELGSKVGSISGSEEKANELKEKCMEKDEETGRYDLKQEAEQNDECKLLLSELDSTKVDTILLDTDVKTTAKLKEIEQLKSVEELEKFLKDNNMEGYIDRLSDLTENPDKMDEIKRLITQNFKAKRMALVDRLKQKFKSETGIKSGPDLNEEDKEKNLNFKNEIANQTISDIETHKKRVETLFEYSNIVSSFLELTEAGSKEVIGTSSTGREVELADTEKESLKGYFSGDSGEGESSSSTTNGGIEYINAINAFIDFKTEEDDQSDQNTQESVQ